MINWQTGKELNTNGDRSRPENESKRDIQKLELFLSDESVSRLHDQMQTTRTTSPKEFISSLSVQKFHEEVAKEFVSDL